IAEEHIFVAFPAIAVPKAKAMILVAVNRSIGVPRPVALNDLGSGFEGDASFFVAGPQRRRSRVAGDIFRAKEPVSITGPPFGKITVAPRCPARFVFLTGTGKRLAIEYVAFVSGAGPDFDAARVGV